MEPFTEVLEVVFYDRKPVIRHVCASAVNPRVAGSPPAADAPFVLMSSGLAGRSCNCYVLNLAGRDSSAVAFGRYGGTQGSGGIDE